MIGHELDLPGEARKRWLGEVERRITAAALIAVGAVFVVLGVVA